MNVKNIVDRVEAAIEPTGYSLYFGMRSMYNTNKNPKDKQVILEPFQLRPARTSLTHYDTQITLWVGLRRSISAKFSSADGANALYIDELLSDATTVLKAIGDSGYFLIKQKFETIPMEYYEADAGVTANSQAFISITIPVRIWI